MTATLRFYAELCRFLPAARRQVAFAHRWEGRVSVKDLIEGLGVPHTEVDLVLINGEPADFRQIVADGDRVAVYPVFESFDIAAVTRVRPEPLREMRFVLDAHLGRLAAYLRLAGFDALYRNDFTDEQVAELARAGRRVVLTRDHGLLKRGSVTHGYFVRETRPDRQLVEIVGRFDLNRVARPFSRCMRCNALLEPVGESDVAAEVPEESRAHYHGFVRCPDCRRVYWKGSHYRRLVLLLDEALRAGQS